MNACSQLPVRPRALEGADALDAGPREHTPARILLVDDNLDVHSVLSRILKSETPSHGFEDRATYLVDTAYQGEEGLECVKTALADGRAYSVAFVDMHMPPGWDGITTAQRMLEADGSLQVVLCSAHADLRSEEISSGLGETDRVLFLRKPFDRLEVRQIARALTSKAQHAGELRVLLREIDLRVQERTRDLEAANAKLAHEIDTPTQQTSDSVYFLQTALADLESARRKLRTATESMASAPGHLALVSEIEELEEELDLEYLGERVPKAFESALDGLERISKIVQAMREFDQ